MRVLTLSTYPVATPRHGGQQRLHHIVAAYRSAGHDTRAAGILGSAAYGPEDGFLPCPSTDQLQRYIASPLLMEDWAIGRLAVDDAAVYAQLSDAIGPVPDVIHVEQPWLSGFAHRFARQAGRDRVKVVYGAANVEYALKQRIVESLLDAGTARTCAELVLQCETAAARNADLVAATSAQDADWLRPHAGSGVVVAGNGVADRPSTLAGVTAANEITAHAKFALYCASSHPPNVTGFFDLFGRGIGFLSPGERLVVAGGAGPAIAADPRFAHTPGLAAHFVAAGEIPEECLQGLLETAHAIVLPLTQGSGTNLKTAEALWAGRWVVATPLAMRGFEAYSSQRGLTVCADAVSFRDAVREAMQSPPLRLSADERLSRRALLWDATLRPLVERLGALAGGRS